MHRPLVRTVTAAALVLTLSASAARAQDPVPVPPVPTPAPAPDSTLAPSPAPAAAPAAAAPTALVVSSADSFLVLVPARTSTAVSQELGFTRDAQQRAQFDRAQSDMLASQVETRIQASKAEIDAFKSKASDAKKAKQEVTRMSAEADRKAAEDRKALLEARRDLRKTEADEASARTVLLNFSIKALELEQILQQRREERAVAPRSGVSGAQQDVALTVLERQVLEAQKQRADAAVDVAQRVKQLVERRLEILKAQAALQSVR